MGVVANTTVDLARAQFATTSIYHFLFVPLTLGLGPQQRLPGHRDVLGNYVGGHPGGVHAAQ